MHRIAEELGLPRKPLYLSIRVLEERHRHKQTKIYRMSLTDMQGRKHNIQATCMNVLTEVSQGPELQELIKSQQGFQQPP